MKPASTPILAAISTLPVIVGFFAVATPAVAEPILYSVEGTVSGNLDGTSFTNDLVNITMAGDTSNIVMESLPGLPGAQFTNPAFSQPGAATVTVATATGVLTDTLPNTAAFVDQRALPIAGFLDARPFRGSAIWLLITSTLPVMPSVLSILRLGQPRLFP